MMLLYDVVNQIQRPILMSVKRVLTDLYVKDLCTIPEILKQNANIDIKLTFQEIIYITPPV